MKPRFSVEGCGSMTRRGHMERDLTPSDSSSYYTDTNNEKYTDLKNTLSYLVHDDSHTPSELELCESLKSVEFVGFGDPQSDQTTSAELTPELVFTPDSDGDTTLHVAIIAPNPEAAIKCINMTPSSCHLDIQNNLFQTPLHLSVITDQLEVLQALLNAGAALERQDRNGNTSLHVACEQNKPDMVRAMLRYLEDDHSQTFGKSGQNILEIRNDSGHTCLHIAANLSQLDIVRELIDHGAEINAKELTSGRTALHEAARSGNKALMVLLLEYNKCNMNAHAYDGHTPFDLARSFGNWDVAMKLAEAGARDDPDSE